MCIRDSPVSEVISDAAAPFQALARQQGKRFICSIQPMLTLRGNDKAIQRLVLLLLDNALKYTPCLLYTSSSRSCSSITRLSSPGVWQGRVRLSTAAKLSMQVSVSYTHLDVYKRQPQYRPPHRSKRICCAFTLLRRCAR